MTGGSWKGCTRRLDLQRLGREWEPKFDDAAAAFAVPKGEFLVHTVEFPQPGLRIGFLPLGNGGFGSAFRHTFRYLGPAMPPVLSLRDCFLLRSPLFSQE